MAELSPFPWFDMLIIMGLIFLNGVFAMSELAIVSARTARLDTLARNGSRGAQTAMRLAADPGKFLSTVQIGITLIGILAGAYSGASLGEPVAARLGHLGLSPELAYIAGFMLVIGLTTYFSLVIGELVPKQFALRSAENVAVLMAIPMDYIARVAAPIVWLLDSSSRIIFRLLGLKRDAHQHVTPDELHMIFADATKSGIIEENERAIMSAIVKLADRPVREIMTPRTEVDWLSCNLEAADISAQLKQSGHSFLPISNGSIDDIDGVVNARDILREMLDGRGVKLVDMAKAAPIVPDQLDAMDVLQVIQRAEVPMALVHDEYGHFEGLVTPADLLRSLAGAFDYDRDVDGHPPIIERADGSMLISGAIPIDILAEKLQIRLPDDRDYATLAGHVLHILRRLPREGEVFDDQGWRFEVVDMDNRRVDKLLVSQVDSDR